MKTVILITTLVCSISLKSVAMKWPGPRVYVVTPSSRPQIDEGRSVPFYYNNWMRRMDTPQNHTSLTTSSTSSTVSTQKTKSPDLIFAEFDPDHMKNIKKLLERERITVKTTTTTSTPSIPIYVQDKRLESENVNYGLPFPMKETDENKSVTKENSDYFAFYNNLYGSSDNLPAPVYVPSTASPITTTLRPTTISTSTEKPTVNNVENIWHIIDSQKHDQYEGQWDEVPISSENEHSNQKTHEKGTIKEKASESDDSLKFDENFALPGFATNSGNGAENESRAIRTEPNLRFPYVNLKPFKMKNLKKPLVSAPSNNKKGNNMYTSLDNFFEIKNPVRGEVEDKGIMRQQQQPIDRYNPAQPYLPSEYGSKSKQSNVVSSPMKTVANLVPPPPPLAPQLTADDFPAPVSYESFPPYAPADTPPAPPKPMSKPKLPAYTDDSDMPPIDASEGDDGPPMDLGYRYKQPPSQPFLPTVSPLKPSYGGYSHEKPSITIDSPPAMDDKPEFHDYSYDKPAPAMPEKPFSGYQYSKPESASPPMDNSHPSYGNHGPPSDDSDYPQLIFDKPHGGSNGLKGGDDSMGMMPPMAPSSDVKPDFNLHGPPGDDNGFPHDFPSDLKFSHDFAHDHDFYHHHHHPTTTTTETPRVNRYSYYYLGKKLYYLPLYFSVYFIVYVGALIIKAVLRHKIVYPNSYRPNDVTATFFTKRSVDSWNISNEHLHELTGRVSHAIAAAAEKYINNKTAKEG